uniref:Uncharacterized protein n=1 Tax=Acrobeloides nanus TaxID=290746 RepID=A0A914CY71_9BILA
MKNLFMFIIIYEIFQIVRCSDEQRKYLISIACQRNPSLVICKTKDSQIRERDFVERTSNNTGKDQSSIDRTGRFDTGKQSDESLNTEIKIKQLRELCQKFYPLAARHCTKQSLQNEYVAKCATYFRDCQRFLIQGDPLAAIGESFSSGVGIVPWMFEVKGVPYYPINEEGAFGAGYNLNVPFGAWGGGYNQNLGVRDYWSQSLQAGGDWVNGRYGYRTGWSVPLVQSLGVEGGGGTDVNVPLQPDKIGTVDVDNHYGVGGYYKHNQHTGVDWRNGEVTSQFGVGVPMAGVGVNTGVGVSFPGVDQWLNAG